MEHMTPCCRKATSCDPTGLTPYEEGYSDYWAGISGRLFSNISIPDNQEYDHGWYDAQNDASKGVYKCVD